MVDDDDLVRLTLRTGLELKGFDVWLAADADEALVVYRTCVDRIAVVLLDVQMPGCDGPQILEALRDLDPGVRVCFMSGDFGVYTVDELTRRGATCFVPKPFLLNELAAILHRAAGAATASQSEMRYDLPA